jgi:hypothetical protein
MNSKQENDQLTRQLQSNIIINHKTLKLGNSVKLHKAQIMKRAGLSHQASSIKTGSTIQHSCNGINPQGTLNHSIMISSIQPSIDDCYYPSIAVANKDEMKLWNEESKLQLSRKNESNPLIKRSNLKSAMRLSLMDSVLFNHLMTNSHSHKKYINKKKTANTSINTFRKLQMQLEKGHLQDGKQSFFMFTSTISNFKNKSEEKRYYATQRELHNLRKLLTKTDCYQQEISVINEVIT